MKGKETLRAKGLRDKQRGRRLTRLGLFLICLLSGPFSPLQAQWHDVLWLFGVQTTLPDEINGSSVLNFLDYPVEPYTAPELVMSFDGATAIWCDSSGQLVYYSNGCYIRGKDYAVLPSCLGLNPGIVYETNCGVPGSGNIYEAFAGYRRPLWGFFLPWPQRDSLVYLFYSDLEVDPPSIPHFYYSLLNENLDGGHGDCTALNVPLLPEGDYFNPVAVKHGNGRDWWVFIGDRVKNKYYRFLLDPQGISPVDSFELDPQIPSYLSYDNVLYISPDGKTFVRWSLLGEYMYLYEIDRCTGELSNVREVQTPEGTPGGGMAFSSDSRFLYMMLGDKIAQYDLWAEDLAASMVIVGVYPSGLGWPNPIGFFMSQLAPNGKIYIGSPTPGRGLNTIERPKKKGLACEVRQPGIPFIYQATSFPPSSPNYRLGPLDGSPCDSLGLDNRPVAWWRHDSEYQEVEFTDESFYEPTQWFWSFGDGSWSEQQNPTHLYPSGGLYHVCLTVSNEHDMDVLCRDIRIQEAINITGVDQLLPSGSYQLYPNPAASQVYLSFELPLAASCTWYLQDVNGRELAQRYLASGSRQYALPLPQDLAGGMYLWALKDSQDRLLARGKLAVSGP